jgi:predicted Zn-dependent protease
MRGARRYLFVSGLIACSCIARLETASAVEGIYEPVELRGKEPHDLIETSGEYHDQFVRRSLLHRDPAVEALVRRVGHALAPESEDEYVTYEFFVIRDPSPNAFAMPNGSIYVHSGMLARLEDSSQLAALLAHEISHVAGHHSIVRFRIKPIDVFDIFLTGGLIAALNGLQFSRELEQEADDRAPAMVAAAGYDPHAVPELMDLLREDFEGLRPRVASAWTTHPEPDARFETSRALVAGMPATDRDDDLFDAVVRPVRLMTVRDYVRADYPYTAIAVAQTLLERYPDDLELRMLLGDAWRVLGPRSEFAPEDFSDKDKRRNLRRRMLRTRSERADELLGTEAGRLAMERNLDTARSIYEDLLARDPGFAPAHRGLGAVYEAIGLPREAAGAYLQYVRQAPEADDRSVIMGRLTALRDQLIKEDQ